jgi:hypothetical protein
LGPGGAEVVLAVMIERMSNADLQSTV